MHHDSLGPDTDLAKANLQLGAAYTIVDQLKAKLEGADSGRTAAGSAGPVFRAAPERLIGERH